MNQSDFKINTPVGLPLAKGKFKRSVVLIISAISLLLASMMIVGCFTTVTPLHDAVFQGDIRTAKELLNNGANIDAGASSDPRLTPLWYATYANAPLEVIRLLVERGANVNTVTKYGETPLTYAAIWHRRDVVTYLVDKGADIDKAIISLDRRRDQQVAMEFLYGIKKEMAAPTQQKDVQITTLDKVPPTIKSDIDQLPLIKVKPNKNAYAIVIGIENYRQKLPKADYAVADAKAVTDYLIKVMGYPEENIVTLTNEHATNVDFAKYFEKWLPNNVDKDSSVFIYYSGHGAPNTKTGDAYLVPYDGDPSFIEQTGYPLRKLYESLNKLQAKKIIVALDSCFSGAGGRSVIAKGSRPLVMNLQSNMFLSKNMTILSASSGDQTSSTYDEKGHGLFTYFLLKGIKNEDVIKRDGSIAISDLFNYMKPQIERIARKQYNNEQTPQLIGAKNN